MFGFSLASRVLILAVALAPVVVQRPDFSGSWASKQSIVDSTGGVTGGSIIRIEQTGSTIKIRRHYGRESLTNPPTVLTITLDGRDSPNPYNMVHRPGLTGAISSKARWEGTHLIIVTTQTMTEAKKKPYTNTTTETFSIDGSRLIVDRVVVTPRGSKTYKDIWVKP